MSFGICLHWDEANREQNHWSYLLAAFSVPEVWEVGCPEGHRCLGQRLGSVHRLPERPIVVVAPRLGRHLKGETPLTGFIHPLDVIYVFGHDHRNLSHSDMGGRPYQSVYIPTDETELFSHQAAAVVLYDRVLKGG